MAAANKVFDTAELLESILLHTRPTDVLLLQRVSHTFKNTIAGSKALQRHAWALSTNSYHPTATQITPNPAIFGADSYSRLEKNSQVHTEKKYFNTSIWRTRVSVEFRFGGVYQEPHEKILAESSLGQQHLTYPMARYTDIRVTGYGELPDENRWNGDTWEWIRLRSRTGNLTYLREMAESAAIWAEELIANPAGGEVSGGWQAVRVDHGYEGIGVISFETDSDCGRVYSYQLC